MNSIETLPAVRESMAVVDSLELFAATFAVATADEYRAGGEDLKRIKAAQKRIEEARTSITAPMNAALKQANDFFRAPAERLAAVEKIVKGKLIAFANEQERIRREAQRIADEAERKARAAAAAAAEAAAKAEAAGRLDEAAKLQALAVIQEMRADNASRNIVPEKVAVSGTALRKVMKFEIVNPAEIPREYLIPDERLIRAVVSAKKLDANIPGVRVWEESTMAAASA